VEILSEKKSFRQKNAKDSEKIHFFQFHILEAASFCSHKWYEKVGRDSCPSAFRLCQRQKPNYSVFDWASGMRW